MIDRIKFYDIVYCSILESVRRSFGDRWYIFTDAIKTDCVPYLMCMISRDMLYEMGY